MSFLYYPESRQGNLPSGWKYKDNTSFLAFNVFIDVFKIILDVFASYFASLIIFFKFVFICSDILAKGNAIALEVFVIRHLSKIKTIKVTGFRLFIMISI